MPRPDSRVLEDWLKDQADKSEGYARDPTAPYREYWQGRADAFLIAVEVITHFAISGEILTPKNWEFK